jgi:hypothetical protein
MFKTTAPVPAGVIILLSLIATTGCSVGGTGPTLGLLGYPIPMSPFFQKHFEDKYWNHLHYQRVPILGPLVAGGPEKALDPPSEDEVMRALEDARPVQGNIPFFYEQQRNNVRITVEPVADYIDPPRVYPLIGPAQLHHAQYKCTVYFAEVTRVGWPIPYTTVDEDAQEVLYIDHNHLHMVGNVNTGPGSNY